MVVDAQSWLLTAGVREATQATQATQARPPTHDAASDKSNTSDDGRIDGEGAADDGIDRSSLSSSPHERPLLPSHPFAFEDKTSVSGQ